MLFTCASPTPLMAKAKSAQTQTPSAIKPTRGKTETMFILQIVRNKRPHARYEARHNVVDMIESSPTSCVFGFIFWKKMNEIKQRAVGKKAMYGISMSLSSPKMEVYVCINTDPPIISKPLTIVRAVCFDCGKFLKVDDDALIINC